jgi:hypothetical protein
VDLLQGQLWCILGTGYFCSHRAGRECGRSSPSFEILLLIGHRPKKITLIAKANFNITFHTPGVLPNFSFSPSATAILTPDASVNIKDNHVLVTYDSVSPPSFDFKWGSLGWANFLLDPLLDGLAEALGLIIVPFVNEALHGHTFNVVKLPAVPVQGFNINLGDVQTTFANVGGKPLLIASGIPSITPA